MGRRVAAGFGPDWLQTEAGDFAGLHVSPPDVQRLLPVFRDVRRTSMQVDAPGRACTAPRAPRCSRAAGSGAGERADWDTAARLATLDTRLMLAGGLDPDNVSGGHTHGAPLGRRRQQRRGVEAAA